MLMEWSWVLPTHITCVVYTQFVVHTPIFHFLLSWSLDQATNYSHFSPLLAVSAVGWRKGAVWEGGGRNGGVSSSVLPHDKPLLSGPALS